MLATMSACLKLMNSFFNFSRSCLNTVIEYIIIINKKLDSLCVCLCFTLFSFSF